MNKKQVIEQYERQIELEKYLKTGEQTPITGLTWNINLLNSFKDTTEYEAILYYVRMVLGLLKVINTDVDEYLERVNND